MACHRSACSVSIQVLWQPFITFTLPIVTFIRATLAQHLQWYCRGWCPANRQKMQSGKLNVLHFLLYLSVLRWCGYAQPLVKSCLVFHLTTKVATHVSLFWTRIKIHCNCRFGFVSLASCSCYGHTIQGQTGKTSPPELKTQLSKDRF